MPSYRYPVSRQEFHELEAYYFRLTIFLNTPEFTSLSTFKQKRIYDELNYMSIVLGILEKLFNKDVPANERPIMAWPVDPQKFGYEALFRFSSAKVASMALSGNASKIGMVCRGKRPQSGGWYFVYESDFDPKIHGNTNINFKP